MRQLFLCFILVLISGCGPAPSSGHPDSNVTVSVSNTNDANANQDSQNGDVTCQFIREPVQVADGTVLCKVTFSCNGAPVASPSFDANIPSDQCVTSDAPNSDAQLALQKQVLGEDV